MLSGSHRVVDYIRNERALLDMLAGCECVARLHFTFQVAGWVQVAAARRPLAAMCVRTCVFGVCGGGGDGVCV